MVTGYYYSDHNHKSMYKDQRDNFNNETNENKGIERNDCSLRAWIPEDVLVAFFLNFFNVRPRLLLLGTVKH